MEPVSADRSSPAHVYAAGIEQDVFQCRWCERTARRTDERIGRRLNVELRLERRSVRFHDARGARTVRANRSDAQATPGKRRPSLIRVAGKSRRRLNRQQDRIARLEKTRVGRREHQPAGYVTENALIDIGIVHGIRGRVFPQQCGTHVPQHTAPDFPLPVHRVARAGHGRIDRNARVSGGGAQVDVAERERIHIHVCRVRIAPDAVVVILLQPAELVGDVAAQRIVPALVILVLGQQRKRIKIRPALAHAVGLQLADAHPAAHEPVGQPVRVFVQHHVGIEVAVSRRRRAVENVHLNLRRGSVPRRRKVRVVESGSILRVGEQCVVVHAAASEVVLLKIPQTLGEPQFVKPVVHKIAPVKKLHHGGGLVVRGARGEVDGKIKDALPLTVQRGLRARQIRTVVVVAVEMRVHVVAARFHHPVVDPAQRRSCCIEIADGEQLPRHIRRLCAGRRRQSGRHRRGTVARINAILHFAHFQRQFAANQHLARFRINDEPEALAEFPAVQLHLPAQPQRVAIERQPHEARARLAGQ